MADEGLPENLIIAGGMCNSGFPGNGIWLDHESVAGMADQIGVKFHADHDHSISAWAGTIEEMSVSRHFIEVPLVAEVEENGKKVKKTKKEKSAYLKFQATLEKGLPGYERVAGSILAHRKHKMTPEVSISWIGENFRYEAETDRIIMGGKFRLLHLGHVPYGAQGPDIGVGITKVQARAASPKDAIRFCEEDGTCSMIAGGKAMELALADGSKCDGTFGIKAIHFLENGVELAANFVEEWGAKRPDLVERLGKALGMDTKVAPSKQEKPVESVESEKKEKEKGRIETLTQSELQDEIKRTEQQLVDIKAFIAASRAKDEVSNTAPENGRTQEPNAPARVDSREMGPMEQTIEQKILAELEKTNTRLTALETSRAAESNLRIAERQQRVAAEYGIALPVVQKFSTVELLDAYEASLKDLRGNGLPARRARPPADDPTLVHQAQLEKERQDWLSRMENLGRLGAPAPVNTKITGGGA